MKTNRVLPRKCTGRSKYPLPTTQEKILHMDITRWPKPKIDWLYSLQPKIEKLYTVSKKRPGADCGSDHELLIATVLVTQSCPTLQPHGLQPTRLLCPWDFPGKDTGMGCHFLLRGSSEPGIEPGSPALWTASVPTELQGNPKFILKLKKVGKTTRLFRYDLNQIPYHYTVDVTNT